MANKTWISNASTDYTVSGNWNPSGQPVDGDALFFNGEGQASVAGLTLAAANDALASISFHEDYTGSFGSAGSKVILVSATTVRFNARGGKVFIDATTGITDLILEAAGVTGFGEVDGIVTNLIVQGAAGSFTITDGAAYTNIDIFESPGFVMTIGDGVTALDRLRANSARIVCRTAIDAGASSYLDLWGGAIFEHEGGSTGILNDVRLRDLARLVHTASQDVQNVDIFPGGTFDGTKQRNPAVTIDAATVYRRGTLNLSNALDSYTVTTLKTYKGAYVPTLGKSI